MDNLGTGPYAVSAMTTARRVAEFFGDPIIMGLSAMVVGLVCIWAGLSFWA